MTAQDDPFPFLPDEERSEPMHFISEVHKKNVSDLFRRYHRRLVGYVTARIPAGSDAREIADEAFAKVLVLTSPESVTSLEAFLFRTARNLAINRSKYLAMQDRKAPVIGFDTRSEDPSPELSLIDLERRKMLRSIVSELPLYIRMAMTLKHWDGLTCPQIVARFAEEGVEVTERQIWRYLKTGLVECRRRILAAEGQEQEASNDDEI